MNSRRVGWGTLFAFGAPASGAQQAPAADLTIRGLFAGLPLLAGLGAALALRGFRLDAAAHAEIRARLEARR